VIRAPTSQGQRIGALENSVRRSGVRGPTSGGEYQINCPFCEVRAGKADSKFKLYANPAKGVWICFRCDARGRGDLSWLGAPGATTEVPRTEFLDRPDGFRELDSKSISMRPYVEYLHSRGVLDHAIRVGAGACLEGRYAGRVVIPHSHLAASGGSWDGFVARAVLPGVRGPKYLYPAGMNRKGTLWGHAWLGHRAKPDPGIWDPGLWVVEGVFDALPLWPHALATFGKNVTGEQIDLMVKLATKGAHNRITVALDGDAWMDAKVLAAQLMLRGVDARWARLPPGEDPGTLGWKVQDYVQG